ncbi:MAG TPA: YdeI/OmpD-associated family protein [Anaerolineales bacterium]
MPDLARPKYLMPEFVPKALIERGLMESFNHHLAYQQNDYVGWITAAKRVESQFKRLNQMLNELVRGDNYLNMDYKPKF